jgi:hypothetical protein
MIARKAQNFCFEETHQKTLLEAKWLLKGAAHALEPATLP